MIRIAKVMDIKTGTIYDDIELRNSETEVNEYAVISIMKNGVFNKFIGKVIEIRKINRIGFNRLTNFLNLYIFDKNTFIIYAENISDDDINIIDVELYSDKNPSRMLLYMNEHDQQSVYTYNKETKECFKLVMNTDYSNDKNDGNTKVQVDLDCKIIKSQSIINRIQQALLY